jgi:hypothetical protein
MPGRSELGQENTNHGSKLMSDVDDAFIKASDDLLALYRGIERSAIDLPLLSVMPLLISMWAFVKFGFFFFVGFFLIIPINFVVLIRNLSGWYLFPGYWRYRPFFLTHLYYVWLWVLRGEAPTVPLIFFRPLLNVFMKAHFETRLRRLRLEIVLRNELSDTARSALLNRLDVALERWKSPRFTGVFFTLLLPGIISFPSWYKQLIDFQNAVGIHMPTNVVSGLVSDMSTTNLLLNGATALGYLLAVPTTVFLAKRGLFIGREPNRICFPGGQGGSGVYLKEKEILTSVGLHAREMPIDCLLLAVSIMMGILYFIFGYDSSIAAAQSQYAEEIHHLNLSAELEGRMMDQFAAQMRLVKNMMIPTYVLSFGLLAIAVLRRRRTGRV